MTLSKNGKRIGRPPGSKNGKTLLKEQAIAKRRRIFDELSDSKVKALRDACVKFAMEGSPQHMKMILDRVAPAEYANETGPTQINIILENFNAQTSPKEHRNAERQIGPPPSAGKVVAINAGEERRAAIEARAEVIDE